MVAEILLKKINEKRTKLGLSPEAIATELNMAEGTVKNMCSHKTDNPGIKTFLPVAQLLGISVDEVLYPQQEKNEPSETSLLALKEIYEYQLSTTKETSETHINNIRTHYKQHHEDLKENYEKRLADKRELIDAAYAQIKELKKGNLIRNIIIGSLGAIPIILFILEIMHPEHGWLRY